MNETIMMKLRGRPVTLAEAVASAHRLINSHFGNPDSARCSIPVSVNDDDVVLIDYLTEQYRSQVIDS